MMGAMSATHDDSCVDEETNNSDYDGLVDTGKCDAMHNRGAVDVYPCFSLDELFWATLTKQLKLICCWYA